MSTALHPELVLPSSILASSPSHSDGVDTHTETTYRAWACAYAAECAILLDTPAVVAATAQTLLHRFFYRKSLRAYDIHCVALAALFLSAKVEECARRMRDVINVGYHVKLRRQGKAIRPITLGGNVYLRWKAELIRLEKHILKDLGFSMYNIMEHPHKFILYYVKALGGDRALAQVAWNYLNDSLRVDLCVRYHAETIACAAIYLAARKVEFALPKETPWYAVFNTNLEDMEDVCERILSVYELQVNGWLPSLRRDWSENDDRDEGEMDQVVAPHAPLLQAANISQPVSPARAATPAHPSVAGTERAPGRSRFGPADARVDTHAESSAWHRDATGVSSRSSASPRRGSLHDETRESSARAEASASHVANRRSPSLSSRDRERRADSLRQHRSRSPAGRHSRSPPRYRGDDDDEHHRRRAASSRYHERRRSPDSQSPSPHRRPEADRRDRYHDTSRSRFEHRGRDDGRWERNRTSRARSRSPRGDYIGESRSTEPRSRTRSGSPAAQGPGPNDRWRPY